MALLVYPTLAAYRGSANTAKAQQAVYHQ